MAPFCGFNLITTTNLNYRSTMYSYNVIIAGGILLYQTAFLAAYVHAKLISITDWVGHVSVCFVATDLFL